MRVHSALTVLAALTSAESTYREKETCVIHDLEIVLLMDASSGTGLMFETIAEQIAETVRSMTESFASVKVGLANFVDKPQTFVGIGTYGGYPGGYSEDWCYDLIQPLAEVDSSSVDGMTQKILAQKIGAGIDMYDAHFEAMVRAATDANVGWSLRDAKSGRKLSKLVLIITDHFGHAQDFQPLSQFVNQYNLPLTCEDGRTVGGFGAASVTGGIPALTVWTADPDSYMEWSQLRQREVCNQEPLTTDEEARKQLLQDKLEPIRVPDVKPFDLNLLQSNPEEHCRYHEYPAYADMKQVLLSEEIALGVVLLDMENPAQPGWVIPTDVWQWTLTDSTALGDVNNAYRVADATGIKTAFYEIVAELFPPEECPTEVPTTKAPTTEQPTTVKPTTEQPTTAARTTEKPTTEAPTTAKPTTEASTTEESTRRHTSEATRRPSTQATRRPTTEPTSVSVEGSSSEWLSSSELASTAAEDCEHALCAGQCCQNLYEIFFDVARRPSSIEVTLTV